MKFLRVAFFLGLWFSVLLGVLVVSAQSSYREIHYGKEEGMQNELVKSAAMDKQGLIWLATDGGLIRYNGFEFEQFLDSLPSNYVKDILRTKHGRLFATTDLCFMEIVTDGKSPRFRTILGGSTAFKDSLLWFPKQLFEDSAGNVWFSDNTRVYRYDGNELHRYELGANDIEASHNWQRSCSFLLDEFGDLYLFTQHGYLYRYNRSDDILVAQKIGMSLGSINHAICLKERLFCVSSDGNTWLLEVLMRDKKFRIKAFDKSDVSYFGRNSKNEIFAGTWSRGLMRVNWSGKELSFEPLPAFGGKNVNSLFVDAEDKLWVSSDNGVSMLYPMSFGGVAQSEVNSYVHDIKTNGTGICFTDGTSVFEGNFNAKTNKWVTKKTIRARNSSFLQSQRVAGGVWVSDNAGKLYFYSDKGAVKIKDFSKYGQAIFSMLVDSKKRVWMCQDGNSGLLCLEPNGELKIYGSKEGLGARPVVVRESPNAEIFVGGTHDTAYFFRINEKTQRAVNLSLPILHPHSDVATLNDLAFTATGAGVYLGTSVGLFLYDIAKQTNTPIDGLARDAIKAISFHKNGDLWCAISRGLVRLRGNDLVVFDERDGLASKTISYRSIALLGDSGVCVGTVAGVSYVHLFHSELQTPTPFFLRVYNDDRVVEFDGSKRFYVNSLFNFQFVAPTYPTKTVEYEYQFLGRDSAWHTVTRPNELFVSNLPLGKYRLAIRARQDGNYSWSKPLLFDFTVHEKWYKRAEVWFTVIVLLSITVVIIVRINIWKLRREKESLESIVAERTSEISLANDKLLVSQRKLLDSKKELEMVLATLQTINNHLESQTTALNSSAIVSMTDGEGYIFYVNEKFCEITGYSASELIGENHRIIKSGVHAQDFYVEMWSTIKTTTWRGEVCNRKKNGDLYWVDATIVPFFDAKGNAFQYMAIRFDISERKKYEKALIDKNAEIEVINQQIIDGINYASFIQKAILPPQQHLDKILPQNFVFYLPKNVVSGDFYWAKELGNKVIVVAGDCTGHGVPGALMSMLGMGILNDVSNHTPLPSASEILEFMRRSVKESLRQTDSASSSNDGMEMALCVYDKSTRMMQFAGARHTLMCRSGDDLLDYPGNLNPIGIFRKEKPFAQHEFFVKPGTWFYMFTDGYPDQFGGMLQKRFLMSRFRSMIGNLNYLSAEEQKDIVSHTFWAWAGKFPQVDDVLVIGFSFDRA